MEQTTTSEMTENTLNYQYQCKNIYVDEWQDWPHNLPSFSIFDIWVIPILVSCKSSTAKCQGFQVRITFRRLWDKEHPRHTSKYCEIEGLPIWLHPTNLQKKNTHFSLLNPKSSGKLKNKKFNANMEVVISLHLQK